VQVFRTVTALRPNWALHVGDAPRARGAQRTAKTHGILPRSKRKRETRLREIHRMIEDLPADEVAVREYEVNINLNPKIGPDWMLRGTQKTVQTPGKNEKQYIAGALNAQSADVHYVEGPRKRSALFVQLLCFLANVCYAKAERIHVFLDNYIIHTSKITQKALEQFNGRIVLHFLPPLLSR